MTGGGAGRFGDDWWGAGRFGDGQQGVLAGFEGAAVVCSLSKMQ